HGSAFQRHHRVTGALGEPAQGLSIDLEVASGVDGKVADRETLRPGERRPSGERELEPGEVELAPHRERNGGERLVDISLEGEPQVHRHPPAGAGVSTMTR